MKIPFLEEIPTFEPRTKIGVRKNMSLEQREILDAIDVIEQKADAALKLGVRAFNIGLLLCALLLLVEGPAILRVCQHWLGGANLTAAIQPQIEVK